MCDCLLSSSSCLPSCWWSVEKWKHTTRNHFATEFNGFLNLVYVRSRSKTKSATNVVLVAYRPFAPNRIWLRLPLRSRVESNKYHELEKHLLWVLIVTARRVLTPFCATSPRKLFDCDLRRDGALDALICSILTLLELEHIVNNMLDWS